jgi:crotonobetainyl-CoA:carnitine CoA-transferase CaiB-like acyl-CoA transferase
VTEPDFANATLRVRNRVALAERIESITVEGPRRHWLARFDAAGIPCGPINNYAEAFADPQIRAREMVVEIEHPTLGRLKTPGSAIKMSETPPVVARAAPLLGEHTREVLREVGCSDGEIAALTDRAG